MSDRKGFRESGRPWLSNFELTPINYGTHMFPSVENAYQAAKGEEGTNIHDFKTCTPGQAKRLGKTLYIRKDWEHVKIRIMSSLLISKFCKLKYRNLLLKTGDEEIVEWNYWHDTFWGKDIETGKGENNLGKILMLIRSELKSGKL